MVSAPRATSASRTARASAAPSAGSVPVPISSMSTSERASARPTISDRFVEVGREGRQIPRDRLFVPDVGEERAEHRQTGPGPDRGHDPALREGRDEPGRLEEDALAARVGTGHHHGRAPPGPAPDRTGRRRRPSVSTRRSGWRAADRSEPAAGSGASSGTRRPPGRGRAGPGMERVEVHEGVQAPPQRVRLGREPRGEVAGGSAGPPGAPRAPDRGARFISSMAIGGSTYSVAPVWDSSWTIPPTSPRALASYGDHVAPFPDRHGAVRDDEPLREPAEVAFQTLHHTGMRAPKPVPNAPELLGGGVQHVALGIHGPGERVLHVVELDEGVPERGQRAFGIVAAIEVPREGARRSQENPEAVQLGGLEHGAVHGKTAQGLARRRARWAFPNRGAPPGTASRRAPARARASRHRSRSGAAERVPCACRAHWPPFPRPARAHARTREPGARGCSYPHLIARSPACGTSPAEFLPHDAVGLLAVESTP